MQGKLKTRIAITSAIAVTAAAALCASASAKLVAGQDPAFGKNGVALSKSTSREASGWEIAAGAGRIVSGYTYEREHPRRGYIELAAFTDDGRRIRTFGVSGVARYSVGTWFGSYATSIDAQGRVLILLGAVRSGNFYFQSLEIARLRADGKLDKSFNRGRPLRLDKGDEFGSASVNVTPSGRIFVFNASPNNDPAVYGITDTGHLDPLYGKRGKVRLPDPYEPFPDPDVLFDVDGTDFYWGSVSDDGTVFMTTQRAAGKIDFPGVGKTSSFVPLIMKFGPTGKLDPAFGSNGVLAISRPEPYGVPMAVGTTADGGVSTTLFTRTPLPPKGKVSRPSEFIQRFAANGLPQRATPSGLPEIPIPITKVHADGGEDDYRFNPDGSLERLNFGDSQYELAVANADGTSVIRHSILKLPRSMDAFYSAVLSSTDQDSFLIGGGVGRRIAVIRVRPSN